MRKQKQKGFIAMCVGVSMLISSFNVIDMKTAKATDEGDRKALTDVLTAEQITLREKLPEHASNITDDQGREVTLQGTDVKMLVKDNGTVRKDISAKWLVDNEMGAGINLGNTMEAVLPVSRKKDAKPADAETNWGQPVTTQAYIDEVHSYGINTIRIPVAWSNADMDDGSYTISEEYLGRVEEIVNYALNDGMYVIINDHWDNQWWAQFGACRRDADGNKVSDEETRAQAWIRYEKYWTQIANRFQGYSDHLIFEGANEELGDRLNDAICINGSAKGYRKPDDAGDDVVALKGNLKPDELYETVNKINQKFVDIIRGTGGNNSYRHLLIPGYDTDIDKTLDERFHMPEDIDENGTGKLFVSVHYYTSWDFCGDDGKGTYTVGDQKATAESFDALKKKFTDNGYAIIIGECGICNPSLVVSSVTQWLNDTFTEAQKISAVPVLWETSQYFDRKTPKMIYKDIAVFYNTINQAQGDTSMEAISGGVPSDDDNSGSTEIQYGTYIDKDLWEQKGAHAYLMFQTSLWDYRNAFFPQKDLGKDTHAFEYIKANGVECTNATVVKDVYLSGDGDYTVSIDGIDLTGAVFNMLGVATDITAAYYPNVKVTAKSIKVDGKEILADAELPAKTEEDKDAYYTFMAIDKWADEGDHPLDQASQDEKIDLPTQSLEIQFTISGLDKMISDINDKTYVDPQTGRQLNGEAAGEPAPAASAEAPVPTAQTSVTATPAGISTASAAVTPGAVKAGLKKNAVFTSGKYKYKVTKVAAQNGKGTVKVVGLTGKGKKARKLSTASTIRYQKAVYKVTGIGAEAFKGAGASAVVLNKNIRTIPSGAFANCKKLKKITFKAKLKKVSKGAFAGCQKTIKVTGGSAKMRRTNVKQIKKSGYKKIKA